MGIKHYKIIESPYTNKFDQMTKKELKEFYDWYVCIIPSRIEILSKTVKASKGFQKWKADFSPQSLIKLEEWIDKNLDKSQQTLDWILSISPNSSHWFNEEEDEKWEKTNETVSLAIDCGIYFGEVMLFNNLTLKWIHGTNLSKRDFYYGQPLISGFGKIDLAPFNLISLLFCKFIKGTNKKDALINLYDVWVSEIE